MSEPTVQDLVESVDALSKTTSELVERYTEAIFGVEASAGSAAEDAKKTAADRVQTGLDAEFTALKANEAKDSAAQAEQAKLDAQEVTQLSTFKQYRDQAQQGATTSTAQAVIATQKGTLATEQAAIATNKANVATEEATKSTTQAGIATQKAQAASDSERVVLQKAQEVSDNTTLVATHTATVVRKSDEVVVNASMVAEDKAVVVQKASEVASNASSASNSVLLSQEWAVGRTPPSSHAAPSNTNNAMYWAQQAQYNANQTFISGGLFTPSVSTPYPSIEGVVRDTIWIIEFPSEDATFTYTSGQLSGRMVKNGDLLFWDTPENEFNLIPTKIGGILSLVTEWGTETGPSVDIRGRYLRKSGDSTTSLMSLPNLAVQALKDLNSETVGYFGAENGDGNYLGNTGRWLRFFAKDSILQVRDQNNKIGRVYHQGYKPTAADVGAYTKAEIDGKIIGRPILLGTEDLNSLMTAGVYAQNLDANTSAASHYPENLAGSLIVTSGAGVQQTYHVYNSSRVWTRARYQNLEWTPWALQYNTLNKPTAADVGLGSVPNYAATNSYEGTSTSLLATQRAAYDAAAAPRLEAERKRKITYGTTAPAAAMGADGDIYFLL
ncbi:pyocin knob domain-containing protein [Vibrio cholerae]|uniref:pyocin knob domain-containing protein n=1 Tax=Vibrio cholerae TaxID=666 RepID=UPI000E6BA159|nr:pyocin knob domain-containing protein [Vibrio cholerae]RJK82754.1 hypothetical protein CHN45_17680 [Vibrio cholerae]